MRQILLVEYESRKDWSDTSEVASAWWFWKWSYRGSKGFRLFGLSFEWGEIGAC